MLTKINFQLSLKMAPPSSVTLSTRVLLGSNLFSKSSGEMLMPSTGLTLSFLLVDAPANSSKVTYRSSTWTRSVEIVGFIFRARKLLQERERHLHKVIRFPNETDRYHSRFFCYHHPLINISV